MLFLAVIGAFAGVLFGSKYFIVAGIVGGLAGGTLGLFAGALGWENFEDFGERCREAFLARRYYAGTFWLIASLGVLLLSYGGTLWLLIVSSRR